MLEILQCSDHSDANEVKLLSAYTLRAKITHSLQPRNTSQQLLESQAMYNNTTVRAHMQLADKMVK
jgi:hypothetical protein